DQYDVIDKHTQCGLDLVERYIKFVKERTEIEQSYAKQLRFSNHGSFQEILNELNDYAGQRELIAENMMTGICVELTKYLQDLKQERKHIVTADHSQNIYADLDDEFDDIEAPIGQCTALYTFEGNSEGTISITDGELLSIMEEDKGDGWMRVLRANGEEGYIPSSYVKAAQ
ncbi:unnamed protein product, partial [Lampetra planeri]